MNPQVNEVGGDVCQSRKGHETSHGTLMSGFPMTLGLLGFAPVLVETEGKRDTTQRVVLFLVFWVSPREGKRETTQPVFLFLGFAYYGQGG